MKLDKLIKYIEKNANLDRWKTTSRLERVNIIFLTTSGLLVSSANKISYDRALAGALIMMVQLNRLYGSSMDMTKHWNPDRKDSAYLIKMIVNDITTKAWDLQELDEPLRFTSELWAVFDIALNEGLDLAKAVKVLVPEIK